MDFGPQPVCNRFRERPSDDEYLHPMKLASCEACGLVQLANPVPASELRPRVDWITYNEPEGHLDELAQTLRDLPGLNPDSTVCGISFKDDSTLARLNALGVENIWRIDPEKDLGIIHAGAGVETIQEALTTDRATNIVQTRGTADLVVARHILEHAHDPLSFTTALKKLVKPGGYLFFEAPDETRAFENFDFSCPWEEHIAYFTPETFKLGLVYSGFGIVKYQSFPYELEDSLVGIAKVREDTDTPTVASLNTERNLAEEYAAGLGEHKERFQRYLSTHRESTGKVALLGAGHLACTFIDLLELKDHIEFVVDDNPHKRGRFMPGSGLPILGSEELVSQNIKLCLLAVAPPVENRVVANNASFVASGGVFRSIFPASGMAIQV